MIRVTAAIIEQDGRYLIAQRKGGLHLQFYWEFPGGKIEESESPRDCLKREIKEEFGVISQIIDFLGAINYTYKDFTIELNAYSVILDSFPEDLNSHEKIRWATIKEIKMLDLAPADKVLLKKIMDKL
jgi:8-oxo-dGTP diphosphatase